MDFEPTLSARFVAYVRYYLHDRGIDPDAICEACGIHHWGGDADTPLPVSQASAMLEMAAEVSDNSCMGIHMARDYHYESAGLLIAATLTAATVEEGLRCLNRYDRYFDTAIETSFDFDQPQATFGAKVICDEGVVTRQLNEYLMVFLDNSFTLSTRSKMPVTEVWFAHGNDQNATVLQEIFQAPVRFARPNTKIFFEREFLKQKHFTRNPLMHEVATNAIRTYFCTVSEHRGFIDRVTREIIVGGIGAPDSAEVIAERLAMSPRTLRRHLAEEGYTFQEAKNLAREKHAKYFLGHTNLSLSEIAFRLGYSEPSAFSRAFRAWTGVTPQNYRQQTQKLFQA